MYLLDTNICIYIIKQSPRQVIDRIKSFQPDQIKISAISIAELEYGASKSTKREQNRMGVATLGRHVSYYPTNK